MITTEPLQIQERNMKMNEYIKELEECLKTTLQILRYEYSDRIIEINFPGLCEMVKKIENYIIFNDTRVIVDGSARCFI